jgi:hypothetical protein
MYHDLKLSKWSREAIPSDMAVWGRRNLCLEMGIAHLLLGQYLRSSYCISRAKSHARAVIDEDPGDLPANLHPPACVFVCRSQCAATQH